MKLHFRRPELGPTIAVILVSALMFSLGFWQLERLQWKNNLLANIEKAQSEPPRHLLSYAPQELPGNEWHNVLVSGTLLNTKELHATPRYYKGQMGYAVLTPLVVTGQSGLAFVLVNRGWVPPSQKEPSARAGGNPSMPVRVEGVIRSNFSRGWLMQWVLPKNNPEKNLWFSYDLAAMRKQTGLDLLPAIIDATRVTLINGEPVKDGPTPFPLEINIRNDHLGYAITWFAIGLTALVMYGLYYMERKPVSERF
jgi:surfeit locus 1 family protein